MGCKNRKRNPPTRSAAIPGGDHTKKYHLFCRVALKRFVEDIRLAKLHCHQLKWVAKIESVTHQDALNPSPTAVILLIAQWLH
jgi:hypothetical protein